MADFELTTRLLRVDKEKCDDVDHDKGGDSDCDSDGNCIGVGPVLGDSVSEDNDDDTDGDVDD